MGNCLMRDSRMEWGGEDWGPAIGPPAAAAKPNRAAAGGIKKGGGGSEPKRAVACKEVKVKITKKQLEELVGKVDLQGLTVQQVLEQLMKASARYESSNQTMTSAAVWRPNLQSIPEFNSFHDREAR